MGTRKAAKSNLKGPGPGRPKGLKNKLPADLKQRVLATLEKLDRDKKGLDECASQDPKWFLENFIKPLLPKNIEARVDVGMTEAARKFGFDLFREFKKGK